MITRLYQNEKIKTGEAAELERICATTTQIIPNKDPPMSAFFILLVIFTLSQFVPIRDNLVSVSRLFYGGRLRGDIEFSF